MKLGFSRCRCSECGEYFNSTYSFDAHRKGDYGNPGEKPGTGRFCLSEFGMESLEMIKNDSGCWITKARMPFLPSTVWQNAGDRV